LLSLPTPQLPQPRLPSAPGRSEEAVLAALRAAGTRPPARPAAAESNSQPAAADVFALAMAQQPADEPADQPDVDARSGAQQQAPAGRSALPAGPLARAQLQTADNLYRLAVESLGSSVAAQQRARRPAPSPSPRSSRGGRGGPAGGRFVKREEVREDYLGAGRPPPKRAPAERDGQGRTQGLKRRKVEKDDGAEAAQEASEIAPSAPPRSDGETKEDSRRTTRPTGAELLARLRGKTDNK
jgi:hypothetical protein